jgi:hypothetical protein
MRAALAVRAAVAAMLFPSLAIADFHTFTVEQLYSSADGEIRFIVLREAAGANGQERFAGHQVTSSHAGVLKTFMIPSNLPSSTTAGRRVLFASDGYVALRTSMPSANLPAPDYTIPNRFIATDGGIVNFASVSQIIYSALPGDGTNARYADSTVAANQAQNFSGASAQVPVVATLAVEFYHAVLDHFFVSSLAPDIDSLDTGRAVGWVRTNQTYKVMPIGSATPPAAFGPVCRFYIPPAKGDSHFFSASPAECADVLQRTTTDPNYAGFVHETPSAYFAVLPDQVTGACPAGLQSLFRLWNQRVDSNHRYTVSTAIRTEMIGRGYAPEGYGPLGVAMCVI